MEVTDDGGILLRQAAIVPLETYSDERVAEFEREGQLTDRERALARAMLRKSPP